MRATLAILLIVSASTARADNQVLLALLGEPQCRDGAGVVVRPLFAMTQGKWVALNTKAHADAFLPKTVHWTITLNGHDIGVLSSTDSGIVPEPAWTYPRDYWHLPEPGTVLPDVLNTAKAFTGWCDPPQHRPIVLATTVHLSDPEYWKQAPSPFKRIKLLFSSFRDTLEGATLCVDSNNPKPYRLRAKDLRVVTRMIARDGRQLIALKLARDSFECGSELGEVMGARWFVVGKTVRYLGSDLSLIDISDYDHDGKSELLFWYSGYNRDGYALYSKRFQQRTDFTWNYH